MTQGGQARDHQGLADLGFHAAAPQGESQGVGRSQARKAYGRDDHRLRHGKRSPCVHTHCDCGHDHPRCSFPTPRSPGGSAGHLSGATARTMPRAAGTGKDESWRLDPGYVYHLERATLPWLGPTRTPRRGAARSGSSSPAFPRDRRPARSGMRAPRRRPRTPRRARISSRARGCASRPGRATSPRRACA